MTAPVRTRTQVVVVGAGPAGLLTAHLLRLQGVDALVLEARSRERVLARVRAGVLEQPVVDLLHEVGLGERLARESLRHGGIHLAFDGGLHRVDFAGLVGKHVTVYGQREVVKDLLAAHDAAGTAPLFEVDDVRLDDLEHSPVVRFRHRGREHEVACDVVVGADGSHGVSRAALPDPQVAERAYPAAWYGVLVEAPPASDELIYARHDDGFALHSMRTAEITRQYVQVPAGTRPDDLDDATLWKHLRTRLESDGVRLVEGRIIERTVAPLRSLVVGRPQHGRLVLVGDAAHVVPPTGAKGLNLAVGDVVLASRAIGALLLSGDGAPFERYSEDAAPRVWAAQHFSWWMTTMLHRLDGDAFEAGLQLARLREVTTNEAAAATLAENYTGLPFASGWEA